MQSDITQSIQSFLSTTWFPTQHTRFVNTEAKLAFAAATDQGYHKGPGLHTSLRLSPPPPPPSPSPLLSLCLEPAPYVSHWFGHLPLTGEIKISDAISQPLPPVCEQACSDYTASIQKPVKRMKHAALPRQASLVQRVHVAPKSHVVG